MNKFSVTQSPKLLKYHIDKRTKHKPKQLRNKGGRGEGPEELELEKENIKLSPHRSQTALNSISITPAPCALLCSLLLLISIFYQLRHVSRQDVISGLPLMAYHLYFVTLC